MQYAYPYLANLGLDWCLIGLVPFTCAFANQASIFLNFKEKDCKLKIVFFLVFLLIRLHLLHLVFCHWPDLLPSKH